MRALTLLHIFPLMLCIAGCNTVGTIAPPSSAQQNSGASGIEATEVASAAPVVARTMLGSYDRSFIMQAGYFTGGEWWAGQVAINDSPSPEMRAFGRVLMEESFQANRSLARLALSKGAEAPLFPDGARQIRLKILEAQPTWDFDEAFVAAQIQEHQAMIPVFETAIFKLQDPDLRDFATQVLPSLVDRLNALQVMIPVGM